MPDFSTSGGGSGIVSALGRRLLLTWGERDEETASGNGKTMRGEPAFERRERAQEEILEEGEREGRRRERERE